MAVMGCTEMLSPDGVELFPPQGVAHACMALLPAANLMTLLSLKAGLVSKFRRSPAWHLFGAPIQKAPIYHLLR